MAKGSLLMGTLSGRLGQSVLVRRNGEQIMRAYVAKIANPKTTGQNYLRMTFATASAAASALSGIIDHSFEGIKYGQDSRSYFIKEAVKALRGVMQRNADGGWAPGACGAYCIKGAGVLVPYFFKVSKGTLTATPVLDNLKTNITGISNALVMQSALNTATFNNDAESYAAALRAAFGCDPGDQMTFIFCGQLVDNVHPVASFNGKNNYQSFVQIARVIFKPFDVIQESGSSLSLFTAVGGGDTYQINSAIINERSINAADVLFKADGSNTLIATGVSPITIFAATMIRSKLVSGKWLRSNASLSVNVRAIAPNGPDVVGSYGAASETNFGSDRYLNNAVPAEQAEDTAVPVPAVTIVEIAASDQYDATAESALTPASEMILPSDGEAFIRVSLNKDPKSSVYLGVSETDDPMPAMVLCDKLADGTFISRVEITTPDASSVDLWLQTGDGYKTKVTIQAT